MKLYIKNYAKIILFLSLLLQYKCNTNWKESPPPEDLLLQKMTQINVPEPSGLALSYKSNFFWCVSDSNSKVYKLDKNGKIIASFMIKGEDLEGVTVIDSLRLAVILERTREVVVIDTSGNELNRKKINIDGRLNEGLEGVCFNKYSLDYYFVNEKHPGSLIKTDSSFTELFRKEIEFAKDYSDIFFAAEDTTLWILSDESKKIIHTDLNGIMINEYSIDVEQPEGLVVDYLTKKVYVVSDKREILYEFKLPVQ
jgi:uncharacterized protein YjiK